MIPLKPKYWFSIAVFIFLILGNIKANAQQNSFYLQIEISESNFEILNLEKRIIKFDNKKILTDEINKIKIKAFSLAYLNSDFDTIEKADTIILNLALNKKYKWSELNIKQIDKYKFLNNKLLNLKNISASPEITEKTLLSILETFENNGYPFASLKLENIEVNDEKISAEIDINSGKQIIIDSVIVNSNFEISNYFIESIIGVSKSDLYKEETIKQISNKLKQISFFSVMASPEVEFNDSLARVILYLKKENANNFDAILGFASDDENSVSFTGYLKLKLMNLFGKASEFNLNWNKLVAGRQSINSNIYYPYLFNTPFGIGYDFNLYKHDTAYLNFSQKPSLKLLFDVNNSIEIYGDFFSSQLISKYVINQLDMKKTSYGLKLQMQNLDYILNPRKGYFFSIDAAVGLKKIIENPNIESSVYDTISMETSNYKTEVTVGFHIPIKSRSTFLIANKSAKLWDNNIYENELYRSGGFEMMRGFEEDEILSSAYSIFTGEYRFLLSQKSFLQLFYDLGFIEKNKKTNRLMSFGTGLKFSTNTGIFSLAFAIGKTNQQSIQFSNTKVHIGYSVVF